MKQSAPTHNIPVYQPYTMSYAPASTYQSYIPEPVPVPSYAPNPQPQPYQAPAFEYYRGTGWRGYAHSLDQFTSYERVEEKKEGLQPQVLSRGFEPKRRKGRAGPPAAQPANVQPPTQYTTQPSIPFPPFLPGTKFPQHNSYYPYPYPYNYTIPWYDYNYGNTAFMQPSMTLEQTQAPIKPPATEDVKRMTEKNQQRQRSSSDATKEEEKDENSESARNNSIDSSDRNATTELKEFNNPPFQNKHKRTKKHKQKVMWVKKNESSESIDTKPTTESGSFLNKVEAAHNMKKFGVATDKETLFVEGQRTYYNVGGINTPQKQGLAGSVIEPTNAKDNEN